MKNFFYCALLWVAGCSATLFGLSLRAQQYDTVRVVTWNLDDFRGGDDPRMEEYRRVLSAIQPDILLVQELRHPRDSWVVLDSILRKLRPTFAFREESLWNIQDFYADYFWDSAKVRMVGPRFGVYLESRSTELAIVEGIAADYRFMVASTHLADGSHPDSVAERNAAMQIWRQALAAYNSPLVWGGTLNFSSSDEPGYTSMTTGDTAAFVDPVNRPGQWIDNPVFADLHTSSTRVTALEDGLRARHDQILLDPRLMAHYVPGSYGVYGNDGNHFGDAVNVLPNSVVPAELAQALYGASRHLPVYLDLVFAVSPMSVGEGSIVPEKMDLR